MFKGIGRLGGCSLTSGAQQLVSSYPALNNYVADGGANYWVVTKGPYSALFTNPDLKDSGVNGIFRGTKAWFDNSIVGGYAGATGFNSQLIQNYFGPENSVAIFAGKAFDCVSDTGGDVITPGGPPIDQSTAPPDFMGGIGTIGIIAAIAVVGLLLLKR